MGLLHTSFASGNILTAGSDYGDTGTSGLNEITNRVNVTSGALGTVSGAGYAVSGAYKTTSGATHVVSGAYKTTSGALVTVSGAGYAVSGGLGSYILGGADHFKMIGSTYNHGALAATSTTSPFIAFTGVTTPISFVCQVEVNFAGATDYFSHLIAPLNASGAHVEIYNASAQAQNFIIHWQLLYK